MDDRRAIIQILRIMKGQPIEDVADQIVELFSDSRPAQPEVSAETREPAPIPEPTPEAEAAFAAIANPSGEPPERAFSLDDLMPAPAEPAPAKQRVYWDTQQLADKINAETQAAVPLRIEGVANPVIAVRKIRVFEGAYGGMSSVSVSYEPTTGVPSATASSIKGAKADGWNSAGVFGVPSETFLCTEAAPEIGPRVNRLIMQTEAQLNRQRKPLVVVRPPVVPLIIGDPTVPHEGV